MLALIAIVMLVGANACHFVLDKPTFSNVTSAALEWRITTNESVTNITDRINPIQTALGFNDSATIHTISVGIIDYINNGSINTNATLFWEFREFPIFGELSLLQITGHVNQTGNRRMLYLSGKSVNITQKIPEVFTIKRVCNKTKPIPPPKQVTPIKLPTVPVKAPVTPAKAPQTPVKAPVHTPVKATPVKQPVHTPIKATPIKAPVHTPVKTTPTKPSNTIHARMLSAITSKNQPSKTQANISKLIESITKLQGIASKYSKVQIPTHGHNHGRDHHDRHDHHDHHHHHGHDHHDHHHHDHHHHHHHHDCHHHHHHHEKCYDVKVPRELTQHEKDLVIANLINAIPEAEKLFSA